MRIFSLILLTATVSGCSIMPEFSKTGVGSFSARDVGCDFNVFTTNPTSEYEEVGLIEFKAGFMSRRSESLSVVRKQAAPIVCESGANGILLWEVNGYGQYLKGTLIHTQ